jgi:hypothetical protein
VSSSARKVALAAVDLARERVAELLDVAGQARPLRDLLVNAYLQGAIDGAQVEKLRAVSRGRYKRRARAADAVASGA